MAKKTPQQTPEKSTSSSPRRASEKGLGRGLKALLGDRPALNAVSADQIASTASQDEANQNQNDRIVAIEKISPNPW